MTAVPRRAAAGRLCALLAVFCGLVAMSAFLAPTPAQARDGGGPEATAPLAQPLASTGQEATTVGARGDGSPRTAADLLDDEVPAAFGPLAAFLRVVRYAGVLLVAGGLAFLARVHDGRSQELPVLRRVLVTAALAAAVATALGVPVQAGVVSGLGLAATADPGLLGDVLASTYGASALVRLGGLLLVLVGVARLPSRSAAAVAGAGAVAALVSFALTGHTASAEQRAFATVANVAHTGAAALWFGGLTLLAVVLAARRRADRDDGSSAVSGATGGARMVARFSTLALVSVAVLFAAGGALTAVQVGSLEAVLTTAYGRVLAGKVAVVVVVLVAALYNNRRLVPAVRQGGTRAWDRLSATVRLEVVGLVVVLGLTGVLVNLVPARADVGPGLFDGREQLTEESTVQLVVDPARPGVNELHIYLLDAAGRIADLEELDVTVRLEPPGDRDPIERSPTVAGPGHYVLIGDELSSAGTWGVAVDVLVADGEQAVVRFHVPVG